MNWAESQPITKSQFEKVLWYMRCRKLIKTHSHLGDFEYYR